VNWKRIQQTLKAGDKQIGARLLESMLYELGLKQKNLKDHIGADGSEKWPSTADEERTVRGMQDCPRGLIQIPRVEQRFSTLPTSLCSVAQYSRSAPATKPKNFTELVHFKFLNLFLLQIENN